MIKIDNSTSKTPKPVIIATIAFVGIIFVLVGTMFYYGSKDPVVNILDNSLQIKAMYGLNIDFSEITDISLIEKSMDDIGIGTRTNGYGGIGMAFEFIKLMKNGGNYVLHRNPWKMGFLRKLFTSSLTVGIIGILFSTRYLIMS